MKKIGLLLIATGKYASLVSQFISSAKEWLPKKHIWMTFLLTDTDVAGLGIPREHLPWPLPTLLRYHAFLKHINSLDCMDYLFYLDVDTRFVASVGDEILGDGLTAVRHSMFWDQPEGWVVGPAGPFEHNEKSQAFTPECKRRIYYDGSLIGGTREAWLTMARKIVEWTNADLSNRIIPRWWDEGYLNRYLAENPPSVTLPPTYAWRPNLPENKSAKIVMLNKDDNAMRAWE